MEILDYLTSPTSAIRMKARSHPAQRVVTQQHYDVNRSAARLFGRIE
jgi:hypothetical protein